jgi:hypothetical protein
MPMLDLIGEDDAASTVYSVFLVEKEDTALSFRRRLEIFTAKLV